jgi:periplasmic divalent cation tolerance protein
MEASHMIVQVSAPTAEEAARIARSAVEQRLAASAQTAPVHTLYRWRGELVERAEHVVTLFTRAPVLDELVACVRAHHSYEVPQIVALPLVAGWPPFLGWIDENTGPCAIEPSGDPASPSA